MCESCIQHRARMAAIRAESTEHKNNNVTFLCLLCGKTTISYLGPWAKRIKGGKGYEKVSDSN